MFKLYNNKGVIELILVKITTRSLTLKCTRKIVHFLQPTRANIHQYKFNYPIVQWHESIN